MAGDDIKLLYSFLLIYVEYPKDLHSKSVVDEVIKKLKNVNNSRVDQILGKYYLKFEKVGMIEEKILLTLNISFV